jgi:hypothetical protein
MQRRALLAAIAALGIPLGARAAGAPVVLELFTSQGCSSCPPADALLGELARRPGMIALAWHVDYWNGLGWHDPYASRFSTERQRAYAERLGTEVFTPGLVVDGAAMLVGSDRAEVEAAIANAPPLRIPVAIVNGPDGAVARVGAASEAVTGLFVAWDPMHETSVGGGENGGRRLREFRIVRAAKVLGAWDGTAREIPLPPIAPGQGATVLVQASDLRVLGAAELAPHPPMPV